MRFLSGRGHIQIPDSLAALVLETAAARPTVAASFGSPYLLSDLMSADYVVAAYDPSDAMQKAATRALAGEIFFSGELPVRI